MEAPHQLGNLGNGTFTPGIDEADAMVIEIDAQGPGEVGKGAVLRLPFHQDGALGIEGFLHFREMHDQVFFDFTVKMERGSAGGLDFLFVVPVHADDLAIVIHQGIGGMGDHEELAIEAVDAEKILHQPQEEGLFVIQDGPGEGQHGPLEVGVQVKLRFIDAHRHRQEPASLFVGDDHGVEGNGPAFLFVQHFDEERNAFGNHELNGGIVGCACRKGLEDFINQEQRRLVGIIFRQFQMESPLIQQGLHFLHRLRPRGQVPFENGKGLHHVPFGQHVSRYFVQGKVNIKEAAHVLQGKQGAIVLIVQFRHHFPDGLFQLQVGFVRKAIVGGGQGHLDPDGPVRIHEIVFLEPVAMGGIFQEGEKITFPDVVVPHNIIHPAVEMKFHMAEGPVIFHHHI